jgi:hypothetical protein
MPAPRPARCDGGVTLRTEMAREELRSSFRPRSVRILFVGESPPAAGSFFYACDSELYRATRDAFHAALPQSRDADFLTYFAASGCYLEDLAHEPINHLIDRSDGSLQKRLQARRAGEPRLARTIAELRPKVIVVLLKGIAANVERAAAAADCANVDRHILTYPSRWHRHRVAYRQELTHLLRSFVQRGMLM